MNLGVPSLPAPRLSLLLVLVLAISGFLPGQGKKTGQNNPSANKADQQSAPTTTVKVTTRMVTLQVVARNAKGQPVTSLTPNDFRIFEQVPPKKEQRPQRIAAFQEVSIAAIAAADKGAMQLPPGVYSNLVTMQKTPVPPTILLVDGLNSSLASQMQMRRQMIKLLASIPPDIPVAVFLLDRNLHLLQNFTTDRSLLRAAVQRTITTGGSELSPTDVRADASALATLVQDNPPPTPAPPAGGAQVSPELQQRQNAAISQQVQWLQQFERETFSTQVSIRVRTTLDALRAIARHVSGYPGRKNLLWISSSFPLAIFPDSDFKFAGMEEYQERFAALANILSDAKIAVYPMDPAGLEAGSFFDASSRPPARSVAIGTVTSATVMREESVRSSNQQTMTQLAEQTGGRVCVNNNDLSDCVKKAVDDGSSYYEIAYYPDSGKWSGEFHRVLVKTTRPGVRLAFREGYYARPQDVAEAEKDSGKLNELQEAACHDLLTSTSILVMAQSVPPDQPGDAKFFIAVDPRLLSFVSGSGGRNLSLLVAACTFDKNGNTLQYLQQPTDLTVNDKDYSALMAQHAFTRTLNFIPNPNTTRLRLVVRDNASGRMGSVDLPFPSGPVPTATPAPALTLEPTPPQ